MNTYPTTSDDDRRALRMLEAVPILTPTIFTDGGPWAMHNMPCAVHRDEKAILNLNTGIFQPSNKARSEGWMLIRPPAWARKFLQRWENGN